MSHRATYSPEDNKLRFYPDWSDGDFDKEIIKAAGYRWAGKQECYVCPRWSPTAEDYALKFAEEIEEEEYTAAERSADRADRFEHYRDKRADEAGVSADAFDDGPQAFGHQDRGRADRQAARHDRLRVKSVTQWRKAEYWQERTRGVIASALYRLRPEVRRTRLKGLESDERKMSARITEATARRKAWEKVLTLDGADSPVIRVETSTFSGIGSETTPAGKLAYAIAANGSTWLEFNHPRTGKSTSLYSHLTDAVDPITPAEAARMFLDGVEDPNDPESYLQRWAEHYRNRIAYERAMLGAEGGAATDLEMVAGGWIGGHQIVRVSKSTATGKPSSVVVRKGGREHRINLERLGENVYRAPTPEELEQFSASEKAHRKAVNAAKPKAPALINPTKEDAERLQKLWNDRAQARYEEHERKSYGKIYNDFPRAEVRYMTQAEYSAAARHAHSGFETVPVATNGFLHPGMWDKSERFPTAFNVRRMYPRSGNSSTPYRIIVITDKPQKPLPLDWAAIEAKAEAVTV